MAPLRAQILKKRGAASAADCVEGLRRFAQGAGKKVLRIDRPDGRRVRKFDGAFGPEGCGLPLRAILIKSALRINLSASYVM